MPEYESASAGAARELRRRRAQELIDNSDMTRADFDEDWWPVPAHPMPAERLTYPSLPDHGIAGKAHGLVYGKRAEDYGHPRHDFNIIAKVWSGLLQDLLKPGAELDAYRIAVLMTGLKLARLVKSPMHHDSRVDTIGYMLTMERLDEPAEEELARADAAAADDSDVDANPVLNPLEEADERAGLCQYIFPYKENGGAESFSQKVIYADSYPKAKAAFEQWLEFPKFGTPEFDAKAEEVAAGQAKGWPKASPEDNVGPLSKVKVPFEPGPQEIEMLREVTSQMEQQARANPTDAEVMLAKDILERRQAYHDQEADSLLPGAHRENPIGRVLRGLRQPQEEK